MRQMRKIHSDESGATIVEFAMVLPVLLIMVIGLFDVGMNLYTTSVVQGTMQKAGRDFSLEAPATRQAAIESFIRDQVKYVAPGAQVTFERNAYFDFNDIGKPEIFDDSNGDNICNNNEAFEDANDNGQWDADRGKTGFGGARDAMVLTAVVTYERLFPIDALIGLDEEITIEASTVLRNQPFDDQDKTIPVGQCGT